MNAGWKDHIPEELLEAYAMGKLSAPRNASLEEHLLVCHACQSQLHETEEYVRVVQTALPRATAPLRLVNKPVRRHAQKTRRLRRSTVNFAVSATAMTAITPA